MSPKSRLALLYVDQRTLAADAYIIGLTILAAFDRDRALAGVQRLLHAWNAGPSLASIAARKRPLPAAAPPGASEIVQEYPGQAAHA